MIEVETREQAIRFLNDVLRHIGANYGGTYAHHLVSVALQNRTDDPIELVDVSKIDFDKLVGQSAETILRRHLNG